MPCYRTELGKTCLRISRLMVNVPKTSYVGLARPPAAPWTETGSSGVFIRTCETNSNIMTNTCVRRVGQESWPSFRGGATRDYVAGGEIPQAMSAQLAGDLLRTKTLPPVGTNSFFISNLSERQFCTLKPQSLHFFMFMLEVKIVRTLADNLSTSPFLVNFYHHWSFKWLY